MAGETLYLETSVISYYTARPSRDIIVAAHQQITWEWWENAISQFTVFISQLVLDEIGRGDPDAIQRRLEVVRSFDLLQITRRVRDLSKLYIKKFAIPPKWEADAIHLAIASVHGVDYLVTWNCTHIANARIMRELPAINETEGVPIPTICTPEEISEGEEHVERSDS